MKITVKAEKAGQVIAQTIFEVKKPERILKRAKRAFEAFRGEHPDVPIFDDDVRVKLRKRNQNKMARGVGQNRRPQKRSRDK